MSTTTLSRLPSVPELVQLLQTAFPKHWEMHVRNLGISPGRDLPPEELARVTERVFWMVPQMGIKDPVAWLANRAQLDAAMASALRVKPETAPAVAGGSTVQRDARELEASQLQLDAAKTSEGSLTISANRKTNVELLNPTTAGDVLPEGAQLAPPIGAESDCRATASEASEILLGDDRKHSKDSDDGAALISAPPEARSAPIESTSRPAALSEDFPSGSIKAELLPRAEAVSDETQADAPKAETTPQKAVGNGRSDIQPCKKQKISAAGSKHRRKLLMRQALEHLRTHPNQLAAARKVGIHPKTLAYWLKRSEAGDPAYELEWRGFILPFHEHCEEAKAEPFGKLLAMAIEWTRERIVYKIDQLAVSLGFEGRDAYLRDDKGLPIVEAIHRVRPKMIRFVLEYGRPEKRGKDAASQKPGVEASIKTRQWQTIKKVLDNDD